MEKTCVFTKQTDIMEYKAKPYTEELDTVYNELHLLSNYGKELPNDFKDLVEVYGMMEIPNRRGKIRVFKLPTENLIIMDEKNSGNMFLDLNHLVKIVYKYRNQYHIEAEYRDYLVGKDNKGCLCVPITDGFETMNYDCKEFPEKEVLTESLGLDNIRKALELTEKLRYDNLFSEQLQRLVDESITLYPAILHALSSRVNDFIDDKVNYDYLERIVTELIEDKNEYPAEHLYPIMSHTLKYEPIYKR